MLHHALDVARRLGHITPRPYFSLLGPAVLQMMDENLLLGQSAPPPHHHHHHHHHSFPCFNMSCRRIMVDAFERFWNAVLNAMMLISQPENATNHLNHNDTPSSSQSSLNVHTTTCLHRLLPQLLLLHSHDFAQAHVNRMLVLYATTYSASFKAAVNLLSQETKSNLERILRSAISEGAGSAPNMHGTSSNSSSTPMLHLDLSRYGTPRS
jgi:hypothetical protein